MSWRANIRDEIQALSLPAQRQGDLIRLDTNESPYGFDKEAASALAAHLAGVEVNRYPDSTAKALRHELAQDLGVSPEGVLIGNGTEEIVRLLCATFSKLKPRETRPRVGYPLPGPASYRSAVLSQGARPLEMSLKDDFGIDAVALERHITGGHPNLLLFSWPNDPTGNLWSREEMEKLIKDHPEIVVAVDETYFDYSQQTLLDLLPRYPHLVILRSLSKIGLAGLRVGFLIGDPDVISEVHKVRPAFNVSSLDQEAALWLLQHHRPLLRDRAQLIVAERERLAQALATLEGVTVWPSCTNFLLLRVPDGPGVQRALLRWNLLVADVSDGGLATSCLRITVGRPEENDLLLQHLPEALANPEPSTTPGTAKHKLAEVVGEEPQDQREAPGLPKFL